MGPITYGSKTAPQGIMPSPEQRELPATYEGGILNGEIPLAERRKQETVSAARSPDPAAPLAWWMHPEKAGPGKYETLSEYDPVLRSHCRLD